MTLVKFGGAIYQEINPPGGRWYRLGRCDVRWWNRCKGAESCDLLDEGKSATKDAEAQQLNSFGDYFF